MEKNSPLRYIPFKSDEIIPDEVLRLEAWARRNLQVPTMIFYQGGLLYFCESLLFSSPNPSVSLITIPSDDKEAICSGSIIVIEKNVSFGQETIRNYAYKNASVKTFPDSVSIKGRRTIKGELEEFEECIISRTGNIEVIKN